LLLLATTLLSKVQVHDWWVRACEFPRLQIASLALLTTALAYFIDDPWRVPALVMGGFVLLLQLYRILPWTPLWKVQVHDAASVAQERCVSVLVANVLTPNRNAVDLIKQIQQCQPAVVLTLESDTWWEEQLDAALDEHWPYSVKIPQDNLYGMHLYSSLPLENMEVKRLIQDDIPSIHGTLVLADGSKIALHALHPRPPAPNQTEESLWRDAELLLVGEQIKDRGKPALLIGDLNDVAWARTTRIFSRVSGMLDPRCGRGMFSTYNAKHFLLRWPLDHIFLTTHFTLKSIKRLQFFGSDHFPIFATVCYNPAHAAEQDEPEADKEEQQDADEIIAEAKSREQVT
jgi:endonuclease/exonuclease/phosphatase (EEP) superfamily protein YafD